MWANAQLSNLHGDNVDFGTEEGGVSLSGSKGNQERHDRHKGKRYTPLWLKSPFLLENFVELGAQDDEIGMSKSTY